MQHLGLAYLAPHLRVARDLERDGADDPAERKTPDRTEPQPAERVDEVEWRQQVETAPDQLRRGRREQLADGDAHEGADEPDGRRVAGVGSGGEEVGRDARADDG